MDKDLKELMQISIIGENTYLSEMIKDIIPRTTQVKENFVENTTKISAEKITEHKKNEEFRIVVYKKENPIISFFKGIRFALKKMKIFSGSNEIKLARNEYFNK